DFVFVVALMYDDAGNPVWYYSAGKLTTPTTFAGPWLQFSGGQTLTGTYHPPNVPATIGQLAVEFTANDEATLTINDDVGAAAMGAEKKGPSKIITIRVKREFKPKPITLPARYDGKFTF